METRDKPLVWLQGEIKSPPCTGGLSQDNTSHTARNRCGMQASAAAVRRSNTGGLTMDARKRRRLAAAGWLAGSTSEFLGLNQVEAALVEVRVALGRFVRAVRTRANLTQTQLADRLQSSQSRMAKLEAGNPDVSLDLLVSAALAAGASSAELGSAFRSSQSRMPRRARRSGKRA